MKFRMWFIPLKEDTVFEKLTRAKVRKDTYFGNLTSSSMLLYRPMFRSIGFNMCMCDTDFLAAFQSSPLEYNQKKEKINKNKPILRSYL